MPEAAETIITQSNAETETEAAVPEGGVLETPFYDRRMLNVGLCKKDIVATSKYKEKGAFCNCVVAVIRIMVDASFIEVHVKVFESGKLEIPGVKDDRVVRAAVEYLLGLAGIYDDVDSAPVPRCLPFETETILINSNFNCGFKIQRETLYRTVKAKYHLTCNYDPCSYPGIQCKYFHYVDSVLPYLRVGTNLPGQKHVDHPQCKRRMQLANIYCVSFFIFRTGSVLIVGRCTETILRHVHRFIVDMLRAERADVEMMISADTKHTHVHHSKTKHIKEGVAESSHSHRAASRPPLADSGAASKGGPERKKKGRDATSRFIIYRTKQTI